MQLNELYTKPESDISDAVDSIYRAESRHVYATLVRLIGDFDLAEDAMHDAFAAALERWPTEGLPRSPRAWLVSCGRFKAIDTIRRRVCCDSKLPDIAKKLDQDSAEVADLDEHGVEDDRLRLIFACCHPALNSEARTALTLREVCGLTTDEIARAFLISTSTVAQRIVRARAKIRSAGIPYQVPAPEQLHERLATVLQVVYLVFNEGYYASSGNSIVRSHLSVEAIRLGRLLLELMPEPEVMGLLALMLLHESRRMARIAESGDVVLLEHQDRSLWFQPYIAEGVSLVERSLSSEQFGPYTVQAAISAVHAEAQTPEQTDWNQIAALYGVLAGMDPSPIVELNRAVAVAMRDGPEAGLELIGAILANGRLKDYHLAFAARADMLRRLGRNAEAITAYQQALNLTHQLPERRFYQGRIAELA